MKSAFLLGFAAAAAVAMAADHAAADIRFTLPGAACRANPGTSAGSNSKGWFVSSATLRSAVHCPVMRDFTDDPMTNLYVRIQDVSDALGAPLCGAFSLQDHGGGYDETEPVEHDNPGGFDSLSLDVADLDVPSNYAVTVKCLIGKNDTILNLRYVEG